MLKGTEEEEQEQEEGSGEAVVDDNLPGLVCPSPLPSLTPPFTCPLTALNVTPAAAIARASPPGSAHRQLLQVGRPCPL